MQEKRRETIEALGEFGLIRRIRDSMPPRGRSLVLGPGDDAAIFAPPPGEHLVLTVDTLTEGVHFRSEWMSMSDLGRRVMVQGLSDVAAMGARPLGAVVALSLPPGTPLDDFDDFLRGLLNAAGRFACPLAGGNLSRSPTSISTTATVAGTVHPGASLRRNRAVPGERVWVTGVPGSASAGLAILEEKLEAAWARPLLDRFLQPVPRIPEASHLRDSAGVKAAIDLSDGVRRCAGLLAEASGCALEIDAAKLPADPALRRASERFGRRPASYALDGGEDFELLFTAAPGAVEKIRSRFEEKFSVPLARIGRVLEGEGLTVIHDPGESEFKHF